MALVLTLEPVTYAVRIDFPVPAGADHLTLTRTGPSGTPAIVRGWSAQAVVPGPVIARDFEAPIGVPLTYTAETWAGGGAHTKVTATITITSAGCADTWLTDLVRSGNTMRVVLVSLEELAYAVPATVHQVLSRRPPIVSSDVAHTPTFELQVLTDTLDERDLLRATLGNGVPVLLRTPPDDGVGNMYMAVTGFAERRVVRTATEAARIFVVQAVQVERPDPSTWLPLAPATYAHTTATYASYAATQAARPTYDARSYDYAGGTPSDVVPWPPDDV